MADAVPRSVLSCTHRAEEGDMFHDPHTDVSEARRPTHAQREVLDLLGVAPAAALVRLSVADWQRVADVADALAQARTTTALVPGRGSGSAIRAA
ncbi:hypothetical protein [Geodermatophilus sp. DSM 44513]|uniref:hypothetical protein n=1 Tax=Geodermatophilus sp. DSM 44513 TaxID=1528104 RepID=UPI001411C1B4|nr:hypothetical protein [Geodermatophilus sp. DSM 44513]WNV77046.1 hypothetical protein RTG05_07175 [Geodermatophilus sp. DSM 44513]